MKGRGRGHSRRSCAWVRVSVDRQQQLGYSCRFMTSQSLSVFPSFLSSLTPYPAEPPEQGPGLLEGSVLSVVLGQMSHGHLLVSCRTNGQEHCCFPEEEETYEIMLSLCLSQRVKVTTYMWVGATLAGPPLNMAR